MKAYEKVAVEFAQALIDARWERARGLLVRQLKPKWSAQELAKTFQSMFEGYAVGPAISVHFDPGFSMEEWPAKQPEDVGWAYVSIQGEGFVEAIAVIVSAVTGTLRIRNIEWGRP